MSSRSNQKNDAEKAELRAEMSLGDRARLHEIAIQARTSPGLE